MATATQREIKTQFENCTQGVLGVVKINRKNEPVGDPVKPGAHVYLTAEEIELTEQAHENPKDSPFVIREIVHRDTSTHEETARFTAAPLRRVTKAPAK